MIKHRSDHCCFFAARERARAAEGALDGRRGGGRDRRGPPPLRGRCPGDQGGGSGGRQQPPRPREATRRERGRRAWATANRGSPPRRRGRWAPEPRRPRGSDAPPRRGCRPRPENPGPAPRSAPASASIRVRVGQNLSSASSTTTAPLPPPPPPPQAFLDNCPGLSDRRSSLRVEAMTYGALFGGDGADGDGSPVVVPVFQRTYCWTDEQVAGWWRDAFQGGESGAAKPSADRLAHGTGRCLFRRVLDAECDGSEPRERESLLCLDGQQRSTTTQLALAAVRDAALALVNAETAEGVPRGRGVPTTTPRGDDDVVDALVRRVEAALWVPGADAEGWIRSAAAQPGVGRESSAVRRGRRPETLRCRLVPSWVDRASFFECITAGAVRHRAMGRIWEGETFARRVRETRYSAGTESTPMGRAKALLDAKAAELVRGAGDRAASVAALARRRRRRARGNQADIRRGAGRRRGPGAGVPVAAGEEPLRGRRYCGTPRPASTLPRAISCATRSSPPRSACPSASRRRGTGPCGWIRCSAG